MDANRLLVRLRRAVGIFALDDERRLLLMNGAAASMVDRPEQDVVGALVDDVVPPGMRERIDQLWTEFLERGGLAGSYRAADGDGEPVHWRYVAIANVLDGLHIVIVPPPEGGALTASDETDAGLTLREVEVLGHVATGATADDIAALLDIGRTTVESHVRRAMERLGARNRAHAIALAMQQGLIQLPDAESMQPLRQGGAS